MRGRELVRSRYSIDQLLECLNSLILDELPLPAQLFNPLYALEVDDQESLLLKQIKWQLEEGTELVCFKVQQVGRTEPRHYSYNSAAINRLFLYSEFSNDNLRSLYNFLGCGYLDSAYISTKQLNCKLVSVTGNNVELGISMEHVAGVLGKLKGLYTTSGMKGASVQKNMPYMFHGVPSPYKNAPPLPI
nr:hypothetical protein [Grapevine virus O]